MSENSIRYLLGIDGGGTKTSFLLTDLTEKTIRHCTLGASNPINVGIRTAQDVLQKGILQICDNIPFEEISVFAGIAGSAATEFRSELNRFLASFSFGRFANGSDTDSVLQLALNGNDGVCVIMGTGIAAFTQSDGARYRTGGWGYLIDKGGSGFHIGSDALASAYACLDGRGGSELILDLVKQKTGTALSDAIGNIYAEGAAGIAAFAPVVFEAYRQGDQHAQTILRRNAQEAASIINTARNKLQNKKAKTVLCGGLCKQKDILHPLLMQYLQSDTPLLFSEAPTVLGAIALAKSNI